MHGHKRLHFFTVCSLDAQRRALHSVQSLGSHSGPDESTAVPGDDKTAHLKGGGFVMAWILLIVAGLLEVGWAVGLKYTEGFTRRVPTIFTVISMVASVGLLGLAARTLPIGTAYGVWVGIGAIGAALLGIVLFQESTSPARLAFLGLMVVAIVGLKITSGH